MIIKDENLLDKFTKIPNELLSNSTLSANARIILFYLLSKPKDWTPDFEDIRRTLIIGRDAVQSAFKNLVDNGYALLKKRIAKSGTKNGSEYIIYMSPNLNPDFNRQPGSQVVGNNREPGQPTTGLTDNREVRLSNNKKETNKKETNNKELMFNREPGSQVVGKKEKKTFSLNEEADLRLALNLNPEQETKFIDYVSYLRESGMPADKQNALVFYENGLRKQKERKQGKQTVSKDDSFFSDLGYRVHCILNGNQFIFIKTKKECDMGKVIYQLIKDKGQSWFDIRLNKLLETKENLSIDEDNIKYLLTTDLALI